MNGEKRKVETGRVGRSGPIAGVLTEVRQGVGAFLGEKRGCVRDRVGGRRQIFVKIGNL